MINTRPNKCQWDQIINLFQKGNIITPRDIFVVVLSKNSLNFLQDFI